MLRSLRWLQSRLVRTGAAIVLLGTAVGCTPTHSTIPGKNAAVPPKPVFPANTTGLGTSPAYRNLSGAGAGLGNPQLGTNPGGTIPTTRVGDPRLMSPTPGTAGPQLQQTTYPNTQSNLSMPSVQTPPVQQADHQQMIPQQQSVNQASYPANSYQQAPAIPANTQVPAQPRQTPQQLPNVQYQQGTLPTNGPTSALPAGQRVPQQSAVPLPMQMSQVPAASPAAPSMVRQPELSAPTVTSPSAVSPQNQGVQQASYNLVLPPLDSPPRDSGTITSPSRVFADQKSSVPPPVTSASSDPSFIPPAQMNPIPPAYVPSRNR